MNKTSIALAAPLIWALAAGPLAAAVSESSPDAWCGTYRDGLIESLARHEANQRRLARERGDGEWSPAGGFRASSVQVEAVGEIAAVEDDGSITIPRSIFDLAGSGLRFKSRKKTPQVYKVGNLGGSIGAVLGDRLALTDDDSIRVDLPFRFRFFGVNYDRMWVNSDGNITFGRPDSASSPRDLGRVLNGPPRIAPFFEDYNPEEADGEGGVYVRFPNPRRAIVTWYRVPRFGLTNENTFQVELSKNGQVKFRWGRVDGEVGVVGLAPGGGSALNLADFSEDKGASFEAAVLEAFADTLSLDEALLAKAFYSTFADEYSHLIVFTDFPIVLGGLGTIAFQRNISNAVEGLGLPDFDAGPIYGSGRPLESFVMMGQVDKYGSDIREKKFVNDIFSGLDVLLHEVGHRWLLFASVDKNGLDADELRGRGDAHWSFYTHSESLLEGSTLQDNGDGTFTTLEDDRLFNDFDLYLMGALPDRRVSDVFAVVGPEVDKGSRAPEAGELIVGERVDVSIEDLQAAEGERVPDSRDADKTLRMAVIVISRSGGPPSQASINLADRLREGLEAEFRRLTGGRLEVDTRLIPR